MIKVNKKINLAQLDKELNGQGLIASLTDGVITEVGLADNNPATELELENAIQNHIAIDEEKANADAKSALLERLGLTEQEAKLLLS